MQIPVFFTAKSTFYVNPRQPPLPRSVKPPLARGSGGRCGHRPPFPGITPFVPVRPLVMPRRTEFALRNSALRQNYGAYRAAPIADGAPTARIRRSFSAPQSSGAGSPAHPPARRCGQSDPAPPPPLPHKAFGLVWGPVFFMLGRTEFALRNSALRAELRRLSRRPIADGAPTARIRRSFSAPQSSGAGSPAHPPARRCGQSTPAPPPPRRKSHCPRRRPAPPSGASAL